MAEALAPQVFTRRASGLVRVMSPYSAFIYNVLTMGLIFPWTYVWAPTAFQGSNLVLGIFFAFLFELPIALAYVWLATALPRSGGDYVFQSRVFGGGFGFTVVFAFFVVWILQWVALSGWLMAVLGIAPTFIGLGVTLNNQAMVDFGAWAATTNGIIIISILNAALSLVLLVTGFRNYVRFQFVMWYAILASFAVMLILFFTTNAGDFRSSIDGFASATGGTPDFFATAKAAAADAGVNFNPPFWLFGTLMVAPIAWTSLQWATYSLRAGRRDQERQRVQEPGVHHRGLAHPDGGAVDPPRGCDGGRHRARGAHGRLLRLLVPGRRGEARRRGRAAACRT